MFRLFFSDSSVSKAGKNIAKGSFLVGLGLIGFGMLVFVLRDLFALLAAGIFFIGGFSAIGYAIRLFIVAHKMGKNVSNTDDTHRENVSIRIGEFCDE